MLKINMNLIVVTAIIVIVVIVVIAYFVSSRRKSKTEGFEGAPEVLHGVYGAVSGTSPVQEAFYGGGSGGKGKGGVVKIEYFYRPTCPSCVAYTPIFDKARAIIARDFPKVDVKKFDVTEHANQEKMSKSTDASWSTIPCVVLWYSNGGKIYLDETKRNHIVDYVKHTESAW